MSNIFKSHLPGRTSAGYEYPFKRMTALTYNIWYITYNCQVNLLLQHQLIDLKLNGQILEKSIYYITGTQI